MILVAFLFLCVLLSIHSLEQSMPCSLYSPEVKGYIQRGDIMIGGLVPVHVWWIPSGNSFRERKTLATCDFYSIVSYLWLQVIKYSIDEINKDGALLPNISLGFHIVDSCADIARSLWGTLWIVSGSRSAVLNYQCQSQVPLVIIGDALSSSSIATATLLGIYNYPQISYAASSPSLSNRFLYPSFFRTMPNDDKQSLILARLVFHMEWNWVGLLSLDDEFGMSGSQILKVELQKLGVCLAYHEMYGEETSLEKMQLITDTVMRSSAKVVIIFSRDPLINRLIDLLIKKQNTGKIWVACTGWANSPMVTTMKYSHIMKGTLGVSEHVAAMPGLKEFLLSVQPATALPNDIFIERFWEIVHNCRWSGAINGSVLCTGDEKLERFKSPQDEFNEFDFRISFLIYNAVYSVAHAIHELIFCVHKKPCTDPSTIKHWQVYQRLKDVRFENKMGEEIYYDLNGDPPADYNIMNWHRKEDGSIEFVNVGRYNMKNPDGEELSINMSAIQWITGRGEIPRSVCSESCRPGFRKAAQKGQPACCFDCIPCSEGEISTQTDVSNCFLCSTETWPNKNNTMCIQKVVEYLSYVEPIGIILTFAAILFCFATLSILCIFLINKETAIVKANNRDITYLLLTSLSISFLCPLLFIGEPRKFTCIFRQGAFGVIFVLSVSSVLAKTITVVIAFRATKPGNNMRRLLGPQVPAWTISVCVLIQLLICISWIITCPSFPERNILIKTGIIVFQCNECSDTLLWCMLGYMAFLACLSFLVAFLARKLPDNFNEAKWITFSMLIFLSVWISFVPAYLSTQGKYMVSVEIFGILSSSAGILVCIFFPKLYIILFRPELNTRGHLLGKGSANKSNM